MTTCRSTRERSQSLPKFRAQMPQVGLAAAAVSISLGAFGCSEALDAVGGDEAFTEIYESAYFQECSGCHAPGAPGRREGIEATQDWSTRDTALASLQRNASGLIGNFAGCNGEPLIGPSSDRSLLVAVFDENVRENYESVSVQSCIPDAIKDETLEVGAIPPALLQDLKDWIDGS